MDLQQQAKNSKDKIIERGEGSSSSSSTSNLRSAKPPEPSVSFKQWSNNGGKNAMNISKNNNRSMPQAFPLPVPEPRTPRTNRTTERRNLQKLRKLQQQSASLQEEIRRANGAPRASEACRQLVESVENENREDPFINNAEPDSRWNRWFTTPRRTRWSCCSF